MPLHAYSKAYSDLLLEPHRCPLFLSEDHTVFPPPPSSHPLDSDVRSVHSDIRLEKIHRLLSNHADMLFLLVLIWHRLLLGGHYGHEQRCNNPQPGTRESRSRMGRENRNKIENAIKNLVKSVNAMHKDRSLSKIKEDAITG